MNSICGLNSKIKKFEISLFWSDISVFFKKHCSHTLGKIFSRLQSLIYSYEFKIISWVILTPSKKWYLCVYCFFSPKLILSEIMMPTFFLFAFVYCLPFFFDYLICWKIRSPITVLFLSVSSFNGLKFIYIW